MVLNSSGCSCALGYYGNGNVCTKCGPGTFQPQIAATVCEPCAPGTFSTAHAALAASACAACEPGKFAPERGASECTRCRRECDPGQYLNASCSPTSDTRCLNCTACGPGEFVYEACAADADAVCDLNVTAYAVFTVHMGLGLVPFLTKPRTYLVAIGTALLGVPATDEAGGNVTASRWAKMDVLERIALFHGQVPPSPTTPPPQGLPLTHKLSPLILCS